MAAAHRIAGKAVVFTTKDFYHNVVGNIIMRALEAPVADEEATFFRSQGYEVVETSDLKVLREALTDPNLKAVAINSHGDAQSMMDEDNHTSIFTERVEHGQTSLASFRNDGGIQHFHVDELIASGCDTADDHSEMGLQRASGAKMFMGNEGHADPYADLHFALRLAASRLTGKSPEIDNKTIHFDAQEFVDAHPKLPTWLKQLISP